MRTGAFEFLAALLSLAALAAGQGVRAQDSGWTISGSNPFDITRTDASKAERVKYRTVSISAYQGENYILSWNILEFAEGETTKTINVADCDNDPPTLFRFHNGVKRSYRIELLDDSVHTILASKVMEMADYNDYRMSGTYLNTEIINPVYLHEGRFASGLAIGKYYDKVYSDNPDLLYPISNNERYSYRYTFDTEPFFSEMSPWYSSFQTYLKSIGDKLYATVGFIQQQYDTGYQYIQILSDNVETYDGPDSGVNVASPSLSLYKACFAGNYGGYVPENEYNWFFPHISDAVNRAAAGNDIEFSHPNNHLFKQAFQEHDPSYRAPDAGALVLSPKTKSITVRFDAKGSIHDSWGVRSLFVRLAILDDIPPVALDRNVAVTMYPYRHSPATISIPFSEIVLVSGTPTITTNWGTFTYEAGSGSNVLAFSGTINAPVGTQLCITGFSGTVTDMAGNAFHWSGTRLGTEVLPRNTEEDFDADSEGRRLIGTKTDLYKLAAMVNGGRSMSGVTFLQRADITCDSDFVLIGTSGSGFGGTYDGGGHAISGINLDGTNYLGLFGYVSGGSVQNVILRNSVFTGRKHVGGIAGYVSKGTVSNCRVENTVEIHTGADKAQNHGGVAGYLAGGDITGCYCAAPVTSDSHSGCTRYGGIAGAAVPVMIGSSGILVGTPVKIDNNLYAGYSVTASGDVGAIIGYLPEESHQKPWCFFRNNYYTLPTLPSGPVPTSRTGIAPARAITFASESVVLGTPSYSYDVSQITGNDEYMRYGNASGTCYSYENATVHLGYTGNVPYDREVVYYVNREPIEGDSFTMPAADVEVGVKFAKVSSLSLTVHRATLGGQTRYWTSFYHKEDNYRLPEGAQAFVVRSDKVLYRLGDGSFIPAGCAVVIMVDPSAITRADGGTGTLTLTKTSDSVELSTVTNILMGRDTDTAASSLVEGSDHKVYVLSQSGGTVGFFEFTGTLPAGKAFYIE